MMLKSLFLNRLFLSFLPIAGFLLSLTPNVKAGGVTITSYGHSALLINGEGKSILLNPFKAVGCTAGLKEPKISADVILASSELSDEGARIARGIFLVRPGSYRIKGLSLEGFAAPHDRLAGRRFGQSTIWRWRQGGLNFAHLGGTAAQLNKEDKLLLGKPDVLIIGVGGGGKVYNGIEAKNIVKELKPRHVIPVQYLSKIKPKNCNLNGLDPFLNAMDGTIVRKSIRTLKLSANVTDKTIIEIMY